MSQNGTIVPRRLTHAELPSIRDATLPQKYESAKRHLAECASIDECKDWADKAAALASYAKQADDYTLEKTALKIRTRAIRRCGELLREIGPSPGGRPSAKPTSAPTQVSRSSAARNAGLSQRQKETALRVSNVPAEEFEAAVESEDPPTLGELAERGKKPAPKPLFDLQGRDPKEFSASTDAQGQLREAAETMRRVDVDVAVRGALPHELKSMRKNAAAVLAWCQRLIAELERAE